jgi:membrane protease YdiL (CAAX protease family)
MNENPKPASEAFPPLGMKNSELYRFVALAYLFGFGTQAPALLQGVHGSGASWLGLTMWAPALASLLSGRAARRHLWSSIKKGGFRSWGYALLLGFSFSLVQNLLVAITSTGQWNQAMFELTSDGSGIAAIHQVRMMLGSGNQSFAFFALNLSVTLCVAALLFGLIGGLGEELGWRATLQGELERRFGALRGTVIVGAIWAFWHLPANLAGYNDNVHPYLNALLLFPLRVILMSFYYAWLTKRSQSVWPAAFAHGANNAIAASTFFKPRSWVAEQATATAAAMIVGGLFAWKLWRGTKVEADADA